MKIIRRSPPVPLSALLRLNAQSGRSISDDRLACGYARYALFNLLQALGIGAGDEVLLPSYICDVVLLPLERLGCSPVFYGIDSRFQVDFSTVTTSSRTKAILTVNYFGFSSNFFAIESFARENGLLWINDNAHGFASLHETTPLERLGDVSITSSRKVLPTLNGAYACINVKEPEVLQDRIRMAMRSLPKEQPYRYWVKAMLGLLGIERGLPDFSQIEGFCETSLQAYRINARGAQLLRSADQDTIRARRRAVYSAVDRMLHEQGYGYLEWYGNLLGTGNSPLAFPVYVARQECRERMLAVARKVGLDIHSWPSLPRTILDKNPFGTVELWKKIVMLPIHQNMEIDACLQALKRVCDAV